MWKRQTNQFFWPLWAPMFPWVGFISPPNPPWVPPPGGVTIHLWFSLIPAGGGCRPLPYRFMWAGESNRIDSHLGGLNLSGRNGWYHWNTWKKFCAYSEEMNIFRRFVIQRNSQWHKCDVGKSHPAPAWHCHIPRTCRQDLWFQGLNFPSHCPASLRVEVPKGSEIFKKQNRLAPPG